MAESLRDPLLNTTYQRNSSADRRTKPGSEGTQYVSAFEVDEVLVCIL